MADGDQGEKDQGLRLDTDAWNLMYGDPSANDGYFIGGAGEKGARWATSGGGFTGNIGENGLKSHIGLGGGESLELGADFKKQMGTLGFNSDGSQMFELYGQGSGLDDYSTGIRGSYGLGGGMQLDPSLSWGETKGEGAATAAFGLGFGGDSKLTGSYSLGEDTNKLSLGLVEGLGNGLTGTRGMGMNFGAGTAENSYKLGDGTNTFGFNQAFGPNGETDTLSFDHKYGGGSLNGSVTGGDNGSGFTLGAKQSLGGAGSLSERFGMQFGPDGTTTTLGMGSDLKLGEGLSTGTNFDAKLGPLGAYDLNGKLSESYRSDGFAQTLGLSGGSNSEIGESFKMGASATGQIAPGLYGSGFGSFSDGSQADPNWFAGGGLTYMPSDKFGITAAGGYGSEGWDARLQADFFKKGISGAGGLEDNRSKAAVSAYLGVSGGGAGGQMNDVFGAGDYSKGWNTDAGPTFTAGIGIGF